MTSPQEGVVERELVLPVDRERLWHALADPDAVAGWFGAEVEWDLRPGGRARFAGDGEVRFGIVRAVEQGRELRFVWWPAGASRADASEVTYRLDPEADGTRLTVTERAAPQDGARLPEASASASGTWTAWDGRMVGVWGETAVPVGAGGR
jgi:uncharacterized protein YndB with AHSA1/START domain